MMRAVQRATLLLALMAGPALQVLAASDWKFKHTPAIWLGVLNFLTSYPFGFFFFAILAYSIAIRAPLGRDGLPRTVYAIAWTVVAQAILLVLASGVLFAVGDMSPRSSAFRAICIVAAIYGLGVGSINHTTLRSGVPAILEIPAHMIAAALPVWLLEFQSPGLGQAPRGQLFAAWPALLALLPYAGLVLLYAPAARSLKPALLAVLFSALPPYAIKAAGDYALSRDNALFWPHRVITKFEKFRYGSGSAR